MEWSVIFKLVVLGVLHWALVPVAVENLVKRQRVLGGRKALWAVAILLLTCFGPLVYLLTHPQVEAEAEEIRARWDR
ncbi:MAG: hypothetical protein AB1603_00875 [Chloroflexota bacterium]